MEGIVEGDPGEDVPEETVEPEDVDEETPESPKVPEEGDVPESDKEE